MEEFEIKRMWYIDVKLNLGDYITDEEKEFYNSNLDKMRKEIEDDYIHWKYHASII